MPDEYDDSRKRPANQPGRIDAGRRRRRESFLADLDEAQRLLERVAPRRTRMAQLRQQQLMRTYLH